MNLYKIALVQDTFDTIAPAAEETAMLFYSRLFKMNPQLRHLFKEDIKHQAAKLMATLSFAVKGLSEPESMIPAIKQLGVRHLTYHVEPHHYHMVADALLWALEWQLGDRFTPQVEEAWTEAYYLLAGLMKEAAAEAIAEINTATSAAIFMSHEQGTRYE